MDNYECIICFENLKKQIAILSCNHLYHYKCLQNWISSQNTLTNICPLCNDSKKVEIINIVDDIKDIYLKKKKSTSSCISFTSSSSSELNDFSTNERHIPFSENSHHNKFFSCCNIL